jgi:2-polyprenyl-3-methyl-5-hydroxy-6-metoxy-1,4-benzoquinol methylase
MADQMTGFLSPFLRRRRIAAAGPFLREGKVLDFGCGVGELTNQIEPDRYLGVDLDRASVETASANHPRHRFETLAEFESRPPVPSFDVISALALIEHLADPGAWLATMGAWLNPEGMLILTTPHPSMRWVHECGARVRLFSREAADEHEDMLDYKALQTIAAGAGLRVAQYRRFLLGCNQLAVIKHLATQSLVLSQAPSERPIS